MVKTCMWGYGMQWVCPRSTASWALGVLGHIWTKQHTIVMYLVLRLSSRLLILTFKWNGEASWQKEVHLEMLV